ncbi:cobalamin B12-binding domain-containing protein [Sphingomonas sp. PB4P5]|uniref:cobalamin B12-binding domain-containing protein n=1 Tax=Parasphingomonas puruogangriensis TaxID=3096155 RepID=UPI002FC628F6
MTSNINDTCCPAATVVGCQSGDAGIGYESPETRINRVPASICDVATRLGRAGMASMTHYARAGQGGSGLPSARDYAGGDERLAAFRMQFDRDHAQSLSSLIEREIIPRLIAAHAGVAAARSPASEQPVDVAEIAAFAPLVMQIDADALLAHIEAILDRGVAVETVMVDLLAPAARLLGEYWEADRCDFVDVTMGLWRLQEVVHEIAARGPSDRAPDTAPRHALFASMPGDQHSFGMVVIDEVFRRGGWSTHRMADAETADLVRCVAKDHYDLVGLTISCDCHIADLTSTIAALRNVSRNPQLCVMVGGRIFSADPDLADQVGADGTARDAKLALKIAGELVRERAWGAAAYS